MKYFAQYDSEGTLLVVGTNIGGTEITKEEYEKLVAIIKEKNVLEDKLCKGEITISDVPAEWQEEIARRVDDRIASKEQSADSDEATIDDYINALTKVGVINNDEN